ncbi:hypothetical protein SDC9_157211 [bioreactor metagenome]|uniref:Uncharacterized protein n=1 Tax=bioreactor metagenome TaxID=1076179 RepID=A0A645F6C1_9ZZZZ
MVLRNEHRRAGGHAKREQFHEKRSPPREADCGNGNVAKPPDHQRIDEPEGRHQQILQRDWYRERQHRQPKRLVEEAFEPFEHVVVLLS